MASTSVGSVCDVSSSDSSDEDENRRFVEAAVLDCHHSTSLNGKTDTKSLPRNVGLPRPRQKEGRNTRPSLRPSKQESHEAENELSTTPEFRAFVGKKLSQIIDSMIEVSGERRDTGLPDKANSVPEELGVRLFSSSSDLVCLSENSPVQKPIKKRPVESSSSDSSEDERLASAAVSHDFIFKDCTPTQTPDISETKHLTGTDNAPENVKKKKKKKKHKDGSNKSSDNGTGETGAPNGTVDIETNGIQCKKKKKRRDKNLDDG